MTSGGPGVGTAMWRIVAGIVMSSLYSARMVERSSTSNLASLLERAARKWPELPALALGAHPLQTYKTLVDRSSRLATALIKTGLRPGDRVAIVSRNTPTYLEALFAIWWAGLVAVPVNAKLHPRELDFVLSDSDAGLALTDDYWSGAIAAPLRLIALASSQYEALFADADAAPVAAVDSTTAAWLFYTSGTTGRPKGVAISHGNLYAMTACFLTDVETIAPGDAI